MDPVNAFLIYILVLWVTLFAILPLGVRGRAKENDVVPGSEPGAPVNANIKKKFLLTTLISAAIWVVVFFLIKMDAFGVT